MNRRELRGLAAVAALLVFAGCSDSTAPTGPELDFGRVNGGSQQVATVEVTPGDAQLNVGESIQLTATARDRKGKVLTGVTFAWSSSDAAIASVSATGAVSGVSAGGPVTITASSDGKKPVAGMATATVRPAAPNLVFFQSARTGRPEIFSIRPDGSAEVQLTTAGGSTPDPSPDDFTVAFVRDFNIWLMNADGSNQRQLTFLSGQTYLSSPRWSPDGSLLAFWLEHENTNLTAEIYVVRRDGSDLRQLTSNSDVIDIHPGWTPDGRIQWTAGNHPTEPGIRAINTDGSGETLLVPMATCGLGQGGYAQFSPDGSRILYEGQTWCGGGIEVFVMDPDGSNRTQLTNSAFSGSASWSPDGSGIVFSQSDVGANGPFRLYIMNPDGTGLAALSSGPSDVAARWR